MSDKERIAERLRGKSTKEATKDPEVRKAFGFDQPASLPFTDDPARGSIRREDVERVRAILARIDHLEKALRRLEAVGSELDDTSPAEVWAELSAALNSARAALKGEDDA